MRRLIYIEIVLLLILSVIVISHDLHKGNLANWDEATYGQICKEMLLTNDWLTINNVYLRK